jgi:predicted TIM-barrel fold metal-dependent hydrolase
MASSILDIHHHIDIQPWSTHVDLAKDYENRIRIMDENGIDQATISPGNSFYRPHGIDDTRRINDLVADYVAKYNDRFPIGLGVVLPLQGDESLVEMERAVYDLGLRGFDWHNMCLGVPIDHEMMYRFLEVAMNIGVPAFIHAFPESTNEAPWRLEKIAGDFPEVTIVALSALCVWSYVESVIRIAERHPNILVDTLFFPVNKILERCVANLGAQRVLFGSDLVTTPEEKSYLHSASLEEIRRSTALNDQEKAQILGQNARQLFGISV